MKKDDRPLQIGVLGCGPIAQIGRIDAVCNARNAEPYAICGQASDLVEAMSAIHEPKVAYLSFDEMLADKEVEAVINATADQFQVPLSLKALA